MRSSVDFPHPDGPISATNSPAAISRSTARTASTSPPNTRLTPRSVIRAAEFVLIFSAEVVIMQAAADFSGGSATFTGGPMEREQQKTIVAGAIALLLLVAIPLSLYFAFRSPRARSVTVATPPASASPTTRPAARSLERVTMSFTQARPATTTTTSVGRSPQPMLIFEDGTTWQLTGMREFPGGTTWWDADGSPIREEP